ncbi:Arm DNA-binding domain-containing protein [Pedobacter yulinensis]|nr:Arm DNA-binding domain-containing protein [Pedobacter yulinensis]
MKVNENLSILFYLNTPKKSRDGLVPIYVRITVDGKKDEFSSGKKSTLNIGMQKLAQAKTAPIRRLSTAISQKQNPDLKNATSC